MSVNMTTKQSFLMIAILCGAWFFSVKPVAAAPFCIELQGAPAECWYYDVKACREEAGKKRGHCSVNLKEIKVSGTGASYCVVDSARMPVCAFQNWKSCEDEAARRSAAVCFQNVISESSDPYRFDRMRMLEE